VSSKRSNSTKYSTLNSARGDRGYHKVLFYCLASGREPVREWLKQLSPADRKRIGEDLYTLQLGWPTGMPLARKLEPNLWEFRGRISNGIVRIFFAEENKALVLLHGFVKKSQKIPAEELTLAKERLANIKLRKDHEST